MIRFVTGTDTGVGKTIVSAVLARRAKQQGSSVRYVKPVQTGLGPGEAGSDADVVGAASGVETHELERFAEPLAPSVAAALEDRPVEIDDLARRTVSLAADVDLLIVEGAGGLLVPLTETATMADLAKAIGAQLVVVVRPGLGTLNHTALTLEAAASRGLEIAEIVVSGYPDEPTITERTNLEQLRAMGPPVSTIEVLDLSRGLDRSTPDTAGAGLRGR